MPTKRPRRPGSDTSGNIRQRLVRLEAALMALRHSGVNVRREEHDEMLKALLQIEQNQRHLEIQFTRIAQLQAELDEVKRNAS
jgi:hypothetical protein